ncbi:hypothetical protein LINGRAHAP2_LOCUS9753 [Linum grandiflorum]
MERLVRSCTITTPIHPSYRQHRSPFVTGSSLPLRKNVMQNCVVTMKQHQRFDFVAASAEPLKSSSSSHFDAALPSKGVKIATNKQY